MEEENQIPTADFSYQVNLSREKVEKKIFTMLCKITDKLTREKQNRGALIVFGEFGSNVNGMRRFGPGRIEKYLNVVNANSEQSIMEIFESGKDGAVIIDDSGQLLGTGIYLTVDNPNLDIPEGTGTRHISAASFSKREDVIATLTMSEETGVVRMWKEGAFTEQYDPNENEV